MYILSHILHNMMVEASSDGQREDNSKLHYHYQDDFLHICYMKVSVTVVVIVITALAVAGSLFAVAETE